jgi:AcrR family transcriptional regulator
MTSSAKLRRPGYAPANAALGRRGLHTRDRIVARAGQLFVAHGYHGTSIDAIAKAVGGSRATIYQYFESKDEIFVELCRQCEPAVLEHGRRLQGLGPDADGIRHLQQWLDEWAGLYDKYATVFLEFPGIGTIEGLPQTNAGVVSDQYTAMITGKLCEAGVRGIDPADAAAALLRISHMVNLYRFRGMFGLTSRANTSASLAIAMQLLLFPDTRAEVLATVTPATAGSPALQPADRVVDVAAAAEPDPLAVSPVRQDVLSAASVLFAERGYYSVAMEDIAAAASVSRATLYRHFSTKVKILAELTDWAVLEGRRLAAELFEVAEQDLDFDELHAWLGRYVRFHRTYGGVIRAWYDGSLSKQLSDAVSQGIAPFQQAATALLKPARLPRGIDPTVAAAIFLAVLGRMTELTVSQHRAESDYDTAELMLLVLKRALIRAAPATSA